MNTTTETTEPEQPQESEGIFTLRYAAVATALAAVFIPVAYFAVPVIKDRVQNEVIDKHERLARLCDEFRQRAGSPSIVAAIEHIEQKLYTGGQDPQVGRVEVLVEDGKCVLHI